MPALSFLSDVFGGTENHFSGMSHPRPRNKNQCFLLNITRSLGGACSYIVLWGDPLEKGMATHSSILAWRIPQTD